MPVWLVTGGSGFLGRHLVSCLEGRAPAGVEVVTTARRAPAQPSTVRFVPADLHDPESVSRLARDLEPEVVFHAAGKTPPAAPDKFYRGNTLATVHLLDALRALRRPSRVLLAGSAAELGPVGPNDLPVRESHPCRPTDSYGLSKWLATAAGLAARAPLEVVVARVFNPVGPGLPASQALGRFAALLAAHEGPGPLVLTVGDLDARRDFVDVRDVAEALTTLALRGRAGLVYHVGTGRSVRVGDGLAALVEMSRRDVRIRVDPALADARGPSDSRAAVERIAEHTGWRPQVSWEQSLSDLWVDALRRRGCH
jgi:GDP-4-dehydro-6-deoxy-D-mannose reductase